MTLCRSESPSRRKKSSSKKSKKSKIEAEPKTKEAGTDAAKTDSAVGGGEEGEAAVATTFTDGLGGQVIYQQRGGPENTYQNVDILRVHPGGHQVKSLQL